jgi:hypothetical protein
MSNQVYVNDTVRITVTFTDTNSSGDTILIEPIEVYVLIKDSSNLVIFDGEGTQLTASKYYYDFTPTKEDTYSVRFTGLLSSGNNVVVQQTLYVSSSSVEYKSSNILGKDEIITFCGEVSPLYLDPEALVPFFPDVSIIEIGEIAHNYSKEVKKILSLQDTEDGTSVPFIAIEYVQAATACELTRTYELGGDDEYSIRLGDLSVTNRSVPRSNLSRDNATTWCQIATVLRKEMISGKVGPTSFVPKGLPSKHPTTDGKVVHPDTKKLIYLSDRDLYGPGRKKTAKDDPMPDRDIRSYD